jgi:hypothetical protein
MATTHNDNSSHMRKRPVLLSTLAEEMGMHPTTVRRDMKRRRGYIIDKRRAASGQMTDVISGDDADRYRAERAAESFGSVERTATAGLELQVAELLTRMRQEIDQVFEDGAREIVSVAAKPQLTEGT